MSITETKKNIKQWMMKVTETDVKAITMTMMTMAMHLDARWRRRQLGHQFNQFIASAGMTPAPEVAAPLPQPLPASTPLSVPAVVVVDMSPAAEPDPAGSEHAAESTSSTNQSNLHVPSSSSLVSVESSSSSSLTPLPTIARDTSSTATATAAATDNEDLWIQLLEAFPNARSFGDATLAGEYGGDGDIHAYKCSHSKIPGILYVTRACLYFVPTLYRQQQLQQQLQSQQQIEPQPQKDLLDQQLSKQPPITVSDIDEKVSLARTRSLQQRIARSTPAVANSPIVADRDSIDSSPIFVSPNLTRNSSRRGRESISLRNVFGGSKIGKEENITQNLENDQNDSADEPTGSDRLGIVSLSNKLKRNSFLSSHSDLPLSDSESSSPASSRDKRGSIVISHSVLVHIPVASIISISKAKTMPILMNANALIIEHRNTSDDILGHSLKNTFAAFVGTKIGVVESVLLQMQKENRLAQKVVLSRKVSRSNSLKNSRDPSIDSRDGFGTESKSGILRTFSRSDPADLNEIDLHNLSDTIRLSLLDFEPPSLVSASVSTSTTFSVSLFATGAGRNETNVSSSRQTLMNKSPSLSGISENLDSDQSSGSKPGKISSQSSLTMNLTSSEPHNYENSSSTVLSSVLSAATYMGSLTNDSSFKHASTVVSNAGIAVATVVSAVVSGNTPDAISTVNAASSINAASSVNYQGAHLRSRAPAGSTAPGTPPLPASNTAAFSSRPRIVQGNGASATGRSLETTSMVSVSGISALALPPLPPQHTPELPKYGTTESKVKEITEESPFAAIPPQLLLLDVAPSWVSVFDFGVLAWPLLAAYSGERKVWKLRSGGVEFGVNHERLVDVMLVALGGVVVCVIVVDFWLILNLFV
ncbi:hypothetical protein HDU84_006109 [Entophlyctis sp. JEL0112]|nr:hypothetical protein HDU84_006109 [Entophlyctis sp. JEL0112]